MKWAGALLLILSTASAGIIQVGKIKEKIRICSALSALCDTLKSSVKYRTNDLKSVMEADRPSVLSFIDGRNIEAFIVPRSLLNRDENEALARLLYGLGKCDAENQLLRLDAFREYVGRSEAKYREDYAKNARVYIAFGVFSGVLISILLV